MAQRQRSKLARRFRHSQKKEPAWRNDPATERQIETLENMGHDIPSGLTKGEASDLIDLAMDEEDDVLDTYEMFERGY